MRDGGQSDAAVDPVLTDAIATTPEQQNATATSSLFDGARFPDANKTQPPVSSRHTEDKLEKLKTSILRIYKQHSNSDRNVTEEEVVRLNELKNNDSVVVKVSD